MKNLTENQTKVINSITEAYQAENAKESKPISNFIASLKKEHAQAEQIIKDTAIANKIVLKDLQEVVQEHLKQLKKELGGDKYFEIEHTKYHRDLDKITCPCCDVIKIKPKHPKGTVITVQVYYSGESVRENIPSYMHSPYLIKQVYYQTSDFFRDSNLTESVLKHRKETLAKAVYLIDNETK